MNIIGTVVPLLVGIAAIPVLADRMGTDRLGLLVLALAVVGYFGILDLGLGRALTYAVADALSRGRHEAISELFWAALALVTVLGIGAGIAMALAAAPLVERVLNVPAALEHETIVATRLLAPGATLVMIGSALRGFLESHQRFGLIAAVRLPTTLLMLAGPACTALFTASLVPAVAILLASRFIAVIAHAVQIFCLDQRPGRPRPVSLRTIRILAGYGGWVSVSNILGPVIVFADRFLVAALLSAAAVAFYAVPADLAVRLTLIPLAVAPVLFPALTMTLGTDTARAARIAREATGWLLVAMLLPALIAVGLAPDLLDVWLGAEFAEKSALPAQLLIVGALCNGAAQVPLAMAQAASRPDLPAKLHAVELPSFLLAAWLLIEAFGIDGAAAAWAGRAALDAAALMLIAQHLTRGHRSTDPIHLTLAGCALAVAFLVSYLPTLPARVAVTAALVATVAEIARRRIIGRGRLSRAVNGVLGRRPAVQPTGPTPDRP